MRRRGSQIAGFFSATFLLALGPLAARSEAAGTGWLRVPAQTVTGQSFILNAVAVPAPGDVWVAGYHWEVVGGAVEYRTLVEHYNGTSFVVVPSPDRETAPAVDFLQGISGTSASDIWTVGVSQPPGTPEETLIEHWDGAAWKIVPSPDPGDLGNVLQAVAAISPTNAWAVGARQDAGTFYQMPLALHWNGRKWNALSVPNPSGCTGHSSLTSVSAVGAGDVWAAGWCGSGGSTPEQGYIEHWDGSSWTIAAAQGTIPANSELYGLAALGRHRVWAVGLARQGSGQTAISVHWNGSQWSSIPADAAGNDASLRAVAGGGGFGTWAVGAGLSPQAPFAMPSSVRFSQGTWHKFKVPVAYGSLWGVAVDPGAAVWAAGTRLDSSGVNQPLVLMRR